MNGNETLSKALVLIYVSTSTFVPLVTLVVYIAVVLLLFKKRKHYAAPRDPAKRLAINTLDFHGVIRGFSSLVGALCSIVRSYQGPN
jgi:uncharacterized membrane protein YfcA